MTKNPAEIAGTGYKDEKLMSRVQKTDGTSRCFAQIENIKRQSLIYEAGVEDQVMLFASGDIAEYQKLNPLVAVHPYVNSVEATSSYSGMIGAKLFQYGNAVYLNNSIPEFGTKMHVKGYLSYSNLLDRWDNALRNGDYTPLDKFIASGSDFVQTDVAELVIQYLDGKGLR